MSNWLKLWVGLLTNWTDRAHIPSPYTEGWGYSAGCNCQIFLQTADHNGTREDLGFSVCNKFRCSTLSKQDDIYQDYYLNFCGVAKHGDYPCPITCFYQKLISLCTHGDRNRSLTGFMAYNALHCSRNLAIFLVSLGSHIRSRCSTVFHSSSMPHLLVRTRVQLRSATIASLAWPPRETCECNYVSEP